MSYLNEAISAAEFQRGMPARVRLLLAVAAGETRPHVGSSVIFVVCWNAIVACLGRPRGWRLRLQGGGVPCEEGPARSRVARPYELVRGLAALLQAHARRAAGLAWRLHVILMFLHVLHVNFVTYVIVFYIYANLHVK